MLTTTGLLADEFYLLAHDDRTGRPRLSSRVTGFGLAGALLGELMLNRAIVVRQGCVMANVPSPDNALTRDVLGQLLDDSKRPVRDWLTYLGQSAADRVAARLGATGLLAPEPSRIPLRAPRWTPTDENRAVLPAVNLTTALMRRRELDESTALLAGLIQAVGLNHPQLWEVRQSPAAQQHLDESLAVLPAPLRELIAHTQTAVASAVATHRA